MRILNVAQNTVFSLVSLKKVLKNANFDVYVLLQEYNPMCFLTSQGLEKGLACYMKLLLMKYINGVFSERGPRHNSYFWASL